MDFAGFVSGSIGGGAGIIVGHPFDTIKVRLQTQKVGEKGQLKYQGIVDCFSRIVKQESVFGLYKGMLSPLYGVAFQNALLFGMQRNMINHFDDSLTGQFYAGTITGAVLPIVIAPVEFSKIQMQMNNTRTTNTKTTFTGPFDVLRHFYRLDGIRGVMRGYAITLIRDTPSTGLYFFLYAYILQQLRPKNHYGDDNIIVFNTLLAGGVCGSLSWAVIYPIDVVKSRIQSEPFKPYILSKSSIDVTCECYREGGYRVFVRGLGVTMLRAFPVNAVTFYVVRID